MPLHLVVLVVGQRPGLVQDGVGDRQLPYVVEQRAQPQASQVSFVQAQLRARGQGVACHALQMTTRVPVPSLDGRRQPHQPVEEELLDPLRLLRDPRLQLLPVASVLLQQRTMPQRPAH